MKKIIKIVSIFSMTAIALALPFYAFAATTDWASSVTSFSQGMQKGGAAVDAGRSDPNEALGANDGVFVSLGYGGELVLEFPTKGMGSLMIASYDVTGGTYPEETADVYVSSDGISWDFVGSASNEMGEDDGITEIDVVDDICIKWVKLVDTTDEALHNDSSDAYDVDAVSLTYDEECIEEERGSDGNDTVTNNNSAMVSNNIVIGANTGGNWAGGSYGGEGGDGGDVVNGDDGDVEDSNTGRGGAGGDAAEGGTIISGDISMDLEVTNRVNYNLTEIDRCACSGEGDGDVRVRNINSALVANSTLAMANTGLNDAEGSYGGEGGDGGDIINNEDGDVEDSNTGNGGNAGAGGAGGFVQTGNSEVRTSLVNRINENITRIMR